MHHPTEMERKTGSDPKNGVRPRFPAIAVQAARNCRLLRALGITVRKTIDTLIATRCIEHDHALLYSDRDFELFVRHLGLRSALAECAASGP